MKHRSFPGARWWKFDFHTHTPASHDFIGNVTPELWLRSFMQKGIDCVAITDHNSGEWIDSLKQALARIEKSPPEWFRPLYLFPGVEISASGEAHILAIFGREKTESDINGLLGAVDYPSAARGKTHAIANKHISEVIEQIAHHGGIPIPAHANGPKGLFNIPTQTLSVVLDNDNLYAMELIDEESRTPQIYTDKKVNWTEVQGSDMHDFNEERFGTYTWIKMDEPSIDGLKLALIDGPVSVNRNMHDNPNLHAECFLEELEVFQSQHIGCTESMHCRFSPFLNTIIGGRGSGKSTLMEFMRLVLRRDKELPTSLQDENRRYYNIGDDHLLTSNSRISLIYRKGEARYRLNWTAKPDVSPSLEEEIDGEWNPCPGEIRSLFPGYIYSQKQIFELARNPRALIDIIDQAPEVDFAAVESQRRDLVNSYKQIEGRQRELKEKIDQEDRLQGELNDLMRQIEQIEQSGHESVLLVYRKRQQQLNEFENLEGKWNAMRHRLGTLQSEIGPARFNEGHFSDHTAVLSSLKSRNEKWKVISAGLSQLVAQAQDVISGWFEEKNSADWMGLLEADIKAYESLSAELEQQGIAPDKYSSLSIQQKTTLKELERINDYRTRLEELETEKQIVHEQVEANRQALSVKRQEFLTGVLSDNPSVMIKIKPLGADWDSIEEEVRQILQCPERFDRDFDDLRQVYYKNWHRRIKNLKERIIQLRYGEQNAKDARFAAHLKSLPQESLSDLMLWFPSDDLQVTFGPNRRRIEQGSPGQKNAALLAFILSYGNEPLLLDQPEDDLDNELIYNLVVAQLRNTKSKRQVIVITHNANIVVNGDAEMVFPLKVVNSETDIRQAASIQEKDVREAICDILEGGREAFEERYKRIYLGG